MSEPSSTEPGDMADASHLVDLDWVRKAVGAAEEKLGQDTHALYVGDVLGITEWFVFTIGGNRQRVRAIVEHVEEVLTRSGGPKPVTIEGKENLNWVLMDYEFFIVHVFSEDAWGYYELDRLWRDVPRLDSVA